MQMEAIYGCDISVYIFAKNLSFIENKRKILKITFSRNSKINVCRGQQSQSAILTNDLQISEIFCKLPVTSLQ
jgi:hypothetical protein